MVAALAACGRGTPTALLTRAPHSVVVLIRANPIRQNAVVRRTLVDGARLCCRDADARLRRPTPRAMLKRGVPRGDRAELRARRAARAYRRLQQATA